MKNENILPIVINVKYFIKLKRNRHKPKVIYLFEYSKGPIPYTRYYAELFTYTKIGKRSFFLKKKENIVIVNFI